jgi:RNA polymerase sigma-70 factor (ECF subfamily)
MNTFIDSKRKKSLKVVTLSQSGDDGDAFDPLAAVADGEAGNPEHRLAAAKIGEHIDAALTALSDKEKTVFVMRHYHDMQINQISESLELAEGTVKSLLFRSVRKLRDRLAHYRDELGLEDSQ